MVFEAFCNRVLTSFRIYKIACKKKSSPQNFGRGFVRRPWHALRLGMGALWQTNGIYLESTKPHAKKSSLLYFGRGFVRRPWRALRLGMGALWQASGVYLGSIQSLAKKIQPPTFWKGICTAPMACLKARDGHPLASERDLFGIYNIACKKKSRPIFFGRGICTAPMA